MDSADACRGGFSRAADNEVLQQPAGGGRAPLLNLNGASLVTRIAMAAGGPADSMDRFSMHAVVWDFSESRRRQQPEEARQAAAEPWLRWLLQQGARLAELHEAGNSSRLLEAIQLLAGELVNFGWLAALLARTPLSKWPVMHGDTEMPRLEVLASTLAGWGHGREALALQQRV